MDNLGIVSAPIWGNKTSVSLGEEEGQLGGFRFMKTHGFHSGAHWDADALGPASDSVNLFKFLFLGGFPRWGIPKLAGLSWKIPRKWMMTGTEGDLWWTLKS